MNEPSFYTLTYEVIILVEIFNESDNDVNWFKDLFHFSQGVDINLKLQIVLNTFIYVPNWVLYYANKVWLVYDDIHDDT